MGYGSGYGYGGSGYGGMMGGGGWFVGVMMFVFGALVLVGIVLLVIWAARASGGHAGGQHHAVPPVMPGHNALSAAAGHDEAVAIAKRRLASGEISPDEYATIMKHLGS